MKDEKARHKRLKDEVYAAYGGYKCVCCGEKETKFLTLDHINEDGYKDRRWGMGFYTWLIRNNFPPIVQILCFNCNCGKSLNGGMCPHLKNDL
jgi:hypothetical protein